MMRREKIVYSLFLIVTVALSSTVAFLYVGYQDSQRSIERESLQTISNQAYFISLDIYDLVSRFNHAHSKIHDDDYQLAQGYISNETRDALYWRTFDDYLGDFRQHGDTFETEMNHFYYLLGEPTHETYENISDTIRYALAQVDFARTTRTQNESHRLMDELYNILGIYEQDGNWTGMNGIAGSFSEMYVYWHALTNPYPGTSTTQPSVMFEWAVGNATRMYQDLLVWHENNPISYP